MSQRKSSQFDDEFVHGAIRNIKVSNFLIYDSAEVHPGPHLNVIIGPNATGKSTIVNAICLGLAGHVKILGRSKDLSAYIKNGCSKGVIEIELHNENGNNHVIKRTLVRNTSNASNATSNWNINGRPAQAKQVEELVASLNIQVSNLCQFLPQDRVADFVKMSNTELLTNTMMAANKELYEMHCQLKEAQKKSSEMDNDFSKLTETLEREKQLNAQLERDVQNIEEKQEQEKKLDNLRLKRPWVEYEEYRLLHIKQKEEKDEVEARYNAAQSVNAPIQRELDKLKRRQEEKTQDFRDMGGKIVQASRQIQTLNDSMAGFVDQLEEVDSNLKAKEQTEANRLKKVRDMTTHIQGMEAQLASMEERDVTPEIERLTQELRTLNSQRYEVDEEMRAFSNDKEGKRMEIKAIEGELSRLRDVDSQKLNVVRRRDKHTYDAILWLRKHRDEFEDVIYEPPMMTLNVKERANAKYVESNIGWNEMKSFICMNSRDSSKFLKKVRDENDLIVNVAMSMGHSSDSYQPPAPIRQYSRFGFWSYLRELVEAPEPVLAILCHLSGLHKIPVGSKKVNDFIDEIPNQCQGIGRYMSDTHSYSFKKSKFSGFVSTRSMDLMPASILIHSVDESRQAELNNKLKELKNEEADLNSQIKELSSKVSQYDKDMEQIKAQIKDLRRKAGEKRTLREKLKTKKASLAQLEEDVFDIEKEKKNAANQICKINTKRLHVFTQQAQKTEDMLGKCRTRCRIGLENYALTMQIRAKETEIAEKSLQLVDLERELAEKREQLARTKERAKQLQNEAKKKCGDPSGLSQEKQRIFKNLPASLEDIDAMIADIQARIDLIFVDNDRGIIEQFHNRKRTIEKLEQKLAGRQDAQQAHRDKIEEIKENWLNPLQHIIEKINIQFSDYFKQIKCAGEVHLKTPDNPEDYENYGIGINVKYGDNKPMKELTQFQSGGERSVATVLYMLALQELSRSPFRCVDEINQGMDAENERRVFELVVKTACRPGTPQYFLLTPKLLPDLLYTERMAVHIVHNGPYMLDHKQWNVEDFIHKRGEFEDDD